MKTMNKNKSQTVLELVEERNRIVEQIHKQRTNESPDFIIRRLENLLSSVDGKIDRKTEKIDIRDKEKSLMLFKSLTAVEGFLFIGSFFGLTILQRLIMGVSYENQVYFFEGIFKYPVSRIILLIAFFTSSFLLALRSERKVALKSQGTNVQMNLKLWMLFNVFFVLITVSVSFLLAVLDPIIPLW